MGVMKLLFILTYYRPHVSGLTIYVQRLAEALVGHGHRVTVLTSQYDKLLPSQETLNGVTLVRVPVSFWISKGVIMFSYPKVILPLLATHDLISIHLPNTPMEAMIVPFLTRYLIRRPITATFHCDVKLPDGLFNRFVNQAVFGSNLIAGLLVDRVIAYTEDYADHSRFLRLFRKKREIIPPPILVEAPEPASLSPFRLRQGPHGEPLIGFAARFAAEKGVEYMLHALSLILKEIPNVKVLFVGEHQNVIGEGRYRERLKPLLAKFRNHWTFLGVLNPKQMATFFSVCDVTVLPSINCTESFGLVQVESMLCGTPVVVTDLPGVRVPVQLTKMGRIVPICDVDGLATAVIEVIQHRKRYVRPRAEIEHYFSMEKTVRSYETLFENLVKLYGREQIT
jgi:glycosyltransferase involved in cell wall biosynthesis